MEVRGRAGGGLSEVRIERRDRERESSFTRRRLLEARRDYDLLLSIIASLSGIRSCLPTIATMHDVHGNWQDEVSHQCLMQVLLRAGH